MQVFSLIPVKAKSYLTTGHFLFPRPPGIIGGQRINDYHGIHGIHGKNTKFFSVYEEEVRKAEPLKDKTGDPE